LTVNTLLYQSSNITLLLYLFKETQDANNDEASEFDKHHKTLLTANAEQGWAAELRCYTSTFQ
jgi:hypothetical protein